MLGLTPNGGPPGRAARRGAGLDAGRQALLLDMLAGLARAQEPEAVWAELAGRLKWLLDFERCDVTVLNPDAQTYHLETVFEARPGIPRVREAHVPLAAGVFGLLLQRGTPDLLLALPSDHGAPLTLVDPWLEGGSLASVFAVRLHVAGQTVGGLHILDLAGHLLFMNPSGQRAWEMDDLTPHLGASWVVCWEGAASQAGAAVAAAAQGAPGHFEGWYRTRRSATLTWWDVLVTPILDGRGQPERLLAIARDITERKAAAHALQQAHDLLEQRVQERTAALHQEIAERQRLERAAQQAEHFALLGRLAAGLSHEIRNPLGAVYLHVDLLAEELCDLAPTSAEVTQSLTEIKTNLARLDDLLQDYLSLVRVGAIQLVPTDMGVFVTQFAQDMTPALATHGITLQLVGLAQLGQVALHQNTFRRVLLNLVHNASDAMPQGGTLTLQGRQQEAAVQLDVRDTGSGISPEHIAKIFEPLHTTKPGGTGLGLYIVQEVVATHGGQVAVQSTVGVGTTFTIMLPMAGATEIT